MYLTESVGLKDYEILEESTVDGIKSIKVKGIFQTADELKKRGIDINDRNKWKRIC